MGTQMTEVMRNKPILVVASLLLLAGCSPRDFLSRRLAADLILASSEFKMPQPFVLQTGVVSNKDYPSPEYVVFQHRGWTSATAAPCPPGIVPPPCWDIALTPSGVETVRPLIPPDDASKSSLAIPVARRQLLGVTGIVKQDTGADVEFTWKWAPLNEVGAALYSSDMHYKSTVGFRQFDDGWRIEQSTPHPRQTMSEALNNAEPTP